MLVPAFLYSLYLTLYKTDTSLRRTLSTGSKGGRLRESWLYTLIHTIILNTNLWHNSLGFKPKVLHYMQRFLSCMAFSIYKVIHVACHLQLTGSWIRYIIIIIHSTAYLTHSRRCHYNSWKYNTCYGFSCSSLKQTHTKQVT